MQFSGLELSAIVKLAVAIAASDGNVAEQEKAAISLELLKFGVDENSVNTLVLGAQAIEYKDALTIVTLMNDTQKKYVAAFLAVIIAADGEILEAEVRVWSLISVLCGLPNMTIGEGIQWKFVFYGCITFPFYLAFSNTTKQYPS